MQRFDETALRKKTRFIWLIIVGMAVAGSFSIGSIDITKDENKMMSFGDKADQEIPTTVSSDLVSDKLAQWFEGFDTNKDGRLQLGEAKNFYYWVEENIAYRYDSENLSTVTGVEKQSRFITNGDGRSGNDYRQTPNETFGERAGDCEDMATLEVSFYNHFGIEAYVVGVNSNNPDELDHAVAIVRMEDFQDELVNSTDLLVYSIGNGMTDVYGNPISLGTYLIIDNAYSDNFGYLDHGPKPNTFEVWCFIPLEKGYHGEWHSVVSRCLAKH